MKTGENFVYPLLAVVRTRLEGADYMPQDSLQFFTLGWDGLQSAIRQGIIAYHFAIVGVHIYDGGYGCQVIAREQAAGSLLQRFPFQLIDAVVSLSTGADQSCLDQFCQMVRDGRGAQVEHGSQLFHCVGLMRKQADYLEAVRGLTSRAYCRKRIFFVQ